MWNSTQISLLAKLITGMQKFTTFRGFKYDLHTLLDLNAQCIDHGSVLSMQLPMPTEELLKVDAACRFLFREFGILIHPDDVNVEYQPRARLDRKLELLRTRHRLQPKDLNQAWIDHQKQARKAEIRAIDCLFVTALPIEFCALIRRLDAFVIGTRPECTRGFATRRAVMWLPDGSEVALVLGNAAPQCL